jgi:hypothetical protein
MRFAASSSSFSLDVRRCDFRLAGMKTTDREKGRNSPGRRMWVRPFSRAGVFV